MTTYKIDSAHSEIAFKVRHLMISNVSGMFKEYDATLELEGNDFTTAKAYFEANAASIDTKQSQRDEHLKSDDFFNAEKFPKLTFTSTSVEKKNDSEFVLLGDLTIRDITKPVRLNVAYNGKITDPYGQEKLGFDISGKINRKDFGLKWNGLTEAGGVVVSDEVRLELNVQMIKQTN